MPRPLVILLCALLVGLAAYWLIENKSGSEQQTTTGASAAGGSGEIDTGVSNGPVVVPEDEISLFEEQYANAVTDLAAAENRLADLTSRLGGVKEQVAQIEARGEDPADHLGEMLPYMEPILDEYLDAESALEDAIERRDATKAALEAAKNTRS